MTQSQTGSASGGSGTFLTFLVAGIGLIAVSHAVIFIRLAEDAPAMLLAASRVTLATMVFLPVALIVQRGQGHAGRREAILSIVSGVLLAVHFGAWIESVQRLTIAESAVLVSLSPIWLALLQLVRGKGLPPRGTTIGIALCLCGLVIIGWDGLQRPEGDPIGLILALIGGLSVAGYLAIGKSVRTTMPTSHYVSYCYGTAAVCLSLVCLGTGVSLTGYSVQIWTAILALGLVSQVMGHTSYNFALGKLSPVFVAICLLGEPIFGSLLGLIYLGEPITTITMIGGFPILVGLWLAIRDEVKATS